MLLKITQTKCNIASSCRDILTNIAIPVGAKRIPPVEKLFCRYFPTPHPPPRPHPTIA